LPVWSTLKGIDAAVARLADGILRNEAMLIVADYDADGATACAVGVRGLRAMGAKVDFLVPNRFEFGYGLTPEIVALAATRHPARSRQPDTRRQRPPANSLRPDAAGRPRIVRGRSSRSFPGDNLRPRLRRRTAAQCRGSHGGHVDRHRLPACRR